VGELICATAGVDQLAGACRNAGVEETTKATVMSFSLTGVLGDSCNCCDNFNCGDAATAEHAMEVAGDALLLPSSTARAAIAASLGPLCAGDAAKGCRGGENCMETATPFALKCALHICWSALTTPRSGESGGVQGWDFHDDKEERCEVRCEDRCGGGGAPTNRLKTSTAAGDEGVGDPNMTSLLRLDE